MTIQWNRDQPVITHLRASLNTHFPFFRTLGYALHASGIGGYVNRSRRQGGFSAHSEGRAADIYLLASVPVEKRLGDELFALMGTNRVAYGIDHLMWDGTVRSAVSPGGRNIVPNVDHVGMHRNHIHVAFTRPGSQLTPPNLDQSLAALRYTLDQEFEARDRLGWAEADQAAQPDRFGVPSPFSTADAAAKDWVSPFA